jgi:lysophospholipase L1-like esterase
MRRLLLAACAAAAAVMLAACATPSADVAATASGSGVGAPALDVRAPDAGRADAEAEPAAPPSGVRFTVLGDSNTAGNLGSLADGIAGGSSWTVATVAAGHELVGGVAHNGWTTVQLAEAAVPVEADVAVVMAGTNDLRRGLRGAETLAAIDAAVDVVGAADVVLVAVPPRTGVELATVRLNIRLERAAAERGWRWLDPWTWVRGERGAWADAACTIDGVHASDGAYARVGLAIAEAIAGWRGVDYAGADPSTAAC